MRVVECTLTRVTLLNPLDTEAEIFWNFAMVLFITYSSDHNKILKMRRVHGVDYVGQMHRCLSQMMCQTVIHNAHGVMLCFFDVFLSPALGEFVSLIQTYLLTNFHSWWRHQFETFPRYWPYMYSWRRHQMETFSALLTLCVGNHRSPVNSPHNGQWRGACFLWHPPEKRLSKQSWGMWFERPSRALWRYCNV